ncbi:unnamed protein product [Parnassius apollo]|uniref:(apollo) hypothetical protein n=1 Tax=Parnassius apollo TaxID=110799 RepID=A0A8S3XCM9_PARAO|nr:unnamed protein product [Parnassius apollo]
MRILIFLLGTVLLPSFVSLQAPQELDADTRKYLDYIVKKATEDIDNNTVDWLKRIVSPNDTQISTESSARTSVPVTPTIDSSTDKLLSKSNLPSDPDLEEDFEDSEKCVTDDGSDGLCVRYHQCDDRGLIDNTTLIDLRAAMCRHYLMKCCLQSEAHKQPKKDKPLPPQSECGWSNPDASILRIKNQYNINKKTYADYGEFPWMVALIKKDDSADWSQKNYLGGGTIIHPSVVVTATHKISLHSRFKQIFLVCQIKCRAGEWDTQTDLELYPYQERDIKKVITHEEYYMTPAYNDISLLILEKPYNLTDAPHIGVACLSPDLPTPGTQCFSMGWGKEFQKKNEYAVILKKVQLPYVPFEECQASLRKTRLSARYNLHPSHICAGGEEGVDTCKGDGGSSLVCPIMETGETTRYAVYGMVAFGIGCGKPIPAVYVNIPHLYRWIGAKMLEERLERFSYRY